MQELRRLVEEYMRVTASGHEEPEVQELRRSILELVKQDRRAYPSVLLEHAPYGAGGCTCGWWVSKDCHDGVTMQTEWREHIRKALLLALAKPTYPVGVSVLVVNRDGRVALGECPPGTKAAGLLSTPGGRIEPDESVFEAAARELKEETGVEKLPEQFKSIGFCEHHRYGDHYFMWYVAVRHDGELENREPDKSFPWTWHKVEDVRPEATTEPPHIFEVIRKDHERTRAVQKIDEPKNMLEKTLIDHFLISVECNHMTRMDKAACVCGWVGAWQDCVGNAGREWAAHVLEKLGPTSGDLSFAALREANLRRCRESYHDPTEWMPWDWSNAMAGEVGEACNVTKKMRRCWPANLYDRSKLSDPDGKKLEAMLANEDADAVIYADLLAFSIGRTLEDCVRDKFNEKSEEIGSEVRL